MWTYTMNATTAARFRHLILIMVWLLCLNGSHEQKQHTLSNVTVNWATSHVFWAHCSGAAAFMDPVLAPATPWSDSLGFQFP